MTSRSEHGRPRGAGGWSGEEEALVRQVLDGAPLAGSPLHGERHWRAVAATGLRLAEATPGADREIVLLFGLFHDARRCNEDHDPDHGRRGAELARDLAPVNGERLDLLVDACARHNGAPPDPDPTVGCCFDGDRLGLLRVGIRVDAAYLSTAAARDEATARWAAFRHEDPPSWADLFRWVRTSPARQRGVSQRAR